MQLQISWKKTKNKMLEKINLLQIQRPHSPQSETGRCVHHPVSAPDVHPESELRPVFGDAIVAFCLHRRF